MLRKNDLIVVFVGLSTIALGLIWPEWFRGLAGMIAYGMMALLFFSFLKISPADLWRPLQRGWGQLTLLAGLKLVALPAAVYYLAVRLAPDYALALLLLSGASTGVTAPFFVGVIGGNVALVLVLAVATSLLLPASLPMMVKLTAGRAVEFDLLNMAGFLALIIFVPLGLALGLKRLRPGLAPKLQRVSFSVSVVLIGLINLGIFGKHAPFIRGNPDQFLLALALGSALLCLTAALGAVVLLGRPSPERAGAAASLSMVNNVLIIVLGVHLDDALTSITAGLYMLPLYVLLMPLAWLARQDQRRALAQAGSPVAPAGRLSAR